MYFLKVLIKGMLINSEFVSQKTKTLALYHELSSSVLKIPIFCESRAYLRNSFVWKPSVIVQHLLCLFIIHSMYIHGGPS